MERDVRAVGRERRLGVVEAAAACEVHRVLPADPLQEDVELLSLPPDGEKLLAVRRERRQRRGPAERQLPEAPPFRRAGLRGQAPSREIRPRREREGRGRPESGSPAQMRRGRGALRGSSGGRGEAARLRNREREIARRLESLLRLLFETAADDVV